MSLLKVTYKNQSWNIKRIRHSISGSSFLFSSMAWLSLGFLFHSLLAGVWLHGLLRLKSYQLFRFPCHLFNGFSVFLFYFYSPFSFTHIFPYFIYFFLKPATYKECELPSSLTKQSLDQMWPAICWMGNKYKESSHLPSVDAESSRACLAFQQGFPAGKLKEKKNVSFFPFPDLTAPLNKVGRKGGHHAMKKWKLISK